MSIESKLELVQKSHSAEKDSPAMKRLQALFDEGSFTEIDSLAKSCDGPAEVVAGFGAVEGYPVYAFAQNSAVAGGAMSKAQAAKIRKIYDLAVKTGSPVVGVYDSAGARLKEADEMLAAYGEILCSSNNLSGVVPQISVVAGPCIGTAALLASSADVVIMSEDAQLELETDGAAGSAQEAAAAGVAHLVAPDAEAAVAQARKLISLLPSNNLAAAPLCEYSDAAGFEAALENCAASMDQGGKADGRALILAVADDGSFVELQKEYGATFTCGLATIGGTVCGVVVSNGEQIDADGCAKAARFVRFCDAFAIPVVTFVNAKGFTSLKEAAKLSHAYAEATTAKIAVVTGMAYGAAFIALAGRAANADVTLAWPSAVISSLNPEAAVSILWNDKLAAMKNPLTDRAKLVKEYMDTEASPLHAAAAGYIEDVIAPAETRARLFAALDMLAGKRVTRLPKKHSNIQL